MSGRILLWATLGIGILTASCGERLTDTGYAGSWHRGNERNQSTIALWQSEGQWKFAWFADSADGTWRIRCDERPVCVESINGRMVAEHSFRLWEDPDDGKLRLACTTKSFEPEDREAHYVDLLEVTDGGKTLWSFTIERDGRRFEADERPRRAFRKISDRVQAEEVR